MTIGEKKMIGFLLQDVFKLKLLHHTVRENSESLARATL